MTASPAAINRYRLPDEKVFRQEFPKDLIVLHFTAGSSVEGAFEAWLSQEINIGTAYIVDRDGTVYEVFDPKYWAYHLGIKGAAAQSHKHDKRSIGIEIVNMGPLKRRGDTLCAWPKNFTQPFCSVADTDKYVTAPFRGFSAYARFPEAQRHSVGNLIEVLSVDFGISAIAPPTDKRDDCDLAFFDEWTGIASHQNFRADKFDIGPAWDWREAIKA